MDRIQLIDKYKNLFWYHNKNKLHEISDSVLVEFILNYGDMQAVRDLLDSLGMEKVAEVFSREINKNRHNYLPLVRNYFLLVFKKHAPQYFI